MNQKIQVKTKKPLIVYLSGALSLLLLISSADYFFAGSATGAAGAVGAAAGFLSLSST
jgi:hypothetical protein